MPIESPFPSAWWGSELPGVRPRLGTYGRYPPDTPSLLSIEFDDSFAWINDEPACEDNILEYARGLDPANIEKLTADASRHSVRLPNGLLRLIESSTIGRRVRSCTGCFIDLASELSSSPIGDGWLIRFLADSQGCLYWYVFVPRVAGSHCVVVTSDYYGIDEDFQQAKADSIERCADGIEQFLYRFWVENEFWYHANGFAVTDSAASHFDSWLPRSQVDPYPKLTWFSRLVKRWTPE